MKFLDRELEEDRECKVLMMEVVEGKPLSKVTVKKFSEADRIHVRTQILQTVKTLYSCDVYLPDISPNNFLVSKSGSVRMIGFASSYDPKAHNLTEEERGDHVNRRLLEVEDILDEIEYKDEISLESACHPSRDKVEILCEGKTD